MRRSRRAPREHLRLVAAVAAGGDRARRPARDLAARGRALGSVVLAAAGLLQTIPSLALLVLMIPLLGIGSPPAIVALFLYGLLPIVRNTHAGPARHPGALRDRRAALGPAAAARGCALVELPLASPSILAGIKTSAVINVGTATLGALIGAGGYGQPILTGIRLDDFGLILQGAVPAALMALGLEALLGAVEKHRRPARPPPAVGLTRTNAGARSRPGIRA